MSTDKLRPPDFFIAGAPRTGTTSLYAYLAQHPEIALSAVKEPAHYHFRTPQPDFELLATRYGDRRERESRRRYQRARARAVIDPVAYSGLWLESSAKNVRGEATPTYMYHADALRLIKSEVPYAKLILILRNPVERAYSQYLQYLRLGVETIYEFDLALAQEPFEVDDYWWGERKYLRQGKYSAHVERCLDLFGAENVLVLLHDNLAAETRQTVERVIAFLNVSPPSHLDISMRRNRSIVPQPTLAVRLARSQGPLKVAVRRLVPSGLRRRLYHGAMNRSISTPPPLVPQTRERLTAFFAADIRRLEEILGQRLTQWLKP